MLRNTSKEGVKITRRQMWKSLVLSTGKHVYEGAVDGYFADVGYTLYDWQRIENKSLFVVGIPFDEKSLPHGFRACRMRHFPAAGAEDEGVFPKKLGLSAIDILMFRKIPDTPLPFRFNRGVWVQPQLGDEAVEVPKWLNIPILLVYDTQDLARGIHNPAADLAKAPKNSDVYVGALDFSAESPLMQRVERWAKGV